MRLIFCVFHPPPRPPPKGDTGRYGLLSLITYYSSLYFFPLAFGL